MKVILTLTEHGDCVLLDLEPAVMQRFHELLSNGHLMFRSGAEWHYSDRTYRPALTIVRGQDIVQRVPRDPAPVINIHKDGPLPPHVTVRGPAPYMEDPEVGVVRPPAIDDPDLGEH